MKDELLWINTGLFQDETIIAMKKQFGIEAIGKLIRIWCGIANICPDGRISESLMDSILQVSRQDEKRWFDWIIEHGLLEKTEGGYQVVFGLVHFEDPGQE